MVRPWPFFRCAGVQRDGAGLQIDVAPLERQDFRLHPPAGQIGELRDRLQGWPQLALHRRELVRLEESHPDVVLSQHRNIGPMGV